MADTDKTSTPPSGFLIFFIVTVIVTVLKIIMPKAGAFINSGYMLVIIISQFFVNLSLTKSLCYAVDYKQAFLITIFPWVMLFGVINMMLDVFPGWLSPFSNTFGYFAASLAGSKDLIRKIFKDPTTQSAGDLSKPLAYIYSDQSLLINQVTIDNFDEFWERMEKTGLMNSNIDKPKLKEKFLGIITLKDTISRCIWQILTGGLITAISYNYIMNSNCMPTAEQAEIDAKKIEKEIDERIQKDEDKPSFGASPVI